MKDFLNNKIDVGDKVLIATSDNFGYSAKLIKTKVIELVECTDEDISFAICENGRRVSKLSIIKI